ncbi:hypothetical protein [Pantoea dispersa]|uniref:hypothetical protein n=1 Tax=Pantoea dispersa TaxID=59814 RepID=UPI0024AF86D7|nr:hypothetical protein [Pantoea dispersa]MDI6636987.1 hypothetical protein [Pantoea dispersa]
MTAEIAVFNRTAIALAADSAVTMNLGTNQKIYNNAEKLFQLSKSFPVGIMIYNDAQLTGAPWELIIKAYRTHFESQSPVELDTIGNYAESLFDFISNEHTIFTQHLQNEYFEYVFRSLVLHPLMKLVQDIDIAQVLQTQAADVSIDYFHEKLHERVTDQISRANTKNYYDNFSQDDLSDARAYCDGFTLPIISQLIPPSMETGLYPEKLISSISELFSLTICKQMDLDSYTGLVIAGYGKTQFYPDLKAYKIYGIFFGKVMKVLDEGKCKGDQPYSAIIPFAQEDEVHTFIQGASQQILSYHVDLYNESFNLMRIALTNELTSQNNSISSEQIHEVLDRHHEEFLTYFGAKRSEYLSLNYIQKVTAMLSSLAKVDLAYMAESLVNLTAFKRKVSYDSDTVGGPIDVAVISKGDGFIWIKRKHYFQKELNAHYFKKS